MEEFFKIFVSIAGSLFAWIEGVSDTPLFFLLIFIVVDYASSIISHYITGTISSSKGAKGFNKKFLLVLLACASLLLDAMMKADGWISNTLIIYLCANEGLSIIENAERGGILVPKFLKDRFASVKEKEENNEMDDISKLQK